MWEQRYCFLKPSRTPSNIRYYSCQELKTLLNIAFLNKNGYKISHIEKMCAEEIHKKVVELESKTVFAEKIVNDLLQQMIDLNTEKFESLLEDHIEKKGIHHAIMNVIFPFLEKTGILHSPYFNHAREHVLSHLIRQKLFVAIDSFVKARTSKRAILFLPVAAQQELGILCIYYLLRKNNVDALYLGTDVSLQDAAYVAVLKKTGYVFTQLFQDRTYKYMNDLHKCFPRSTTVIFDNSVPQQAHKLFPGIHIIPSLAEVNKFLASLSNSHII